MEQFYYSASTGQTYSGYQMQALFGINVSTMDISVLNYLGFYPVQASSPDFDTQLYNPTSSWTIVPISPSGYGAELTFTPVAKPLPEAQAGGTAEVKTTANQEETVYLANNSLSVEVMTAVAGQLLVDRPAALQAYLADMQIISDRLGNQIAAINAATTVDEINNIVNPPTGIISLFRTGTKLEQANFQEFSSLTLTESDTELYVPGTATTISYTGSSFPATPGAFTLGDYLIQLRQVANGLVIAEFEVTEIDTEYSF